MDTEPSKSETQLERTLGPLMLWGLGVGYVISGNYFGWNLGLPKGGPLGLFAATLMVTVMYVTFVISYTELSCAIPRAGGVFVYASRALGPGLGFLGGMAQLVEFVFAPPAIAAAIGAYFGQIMPGVSPLGVAMVAYLIFTGLNIYGVRQSAIFELIITVIAVVELIVFAGVTAPHFSWEAFSSNPLPNGWQGAFESIPYAIWFYLAIEGIANVAEETKNPQKDMVVGFSSAMGTLVILAMMVFFSAVGVNGWETVVYEPGTLVESDSPLPLALGHVMGRQHYLYHLIVSIGLFGLIASFHGIILCAGRATFEFGRVGYAPRVLGKTLPHRKTPAVALITNMLCGIVALLTGKTGEIITISVFGALTLYVVSMIALFKLRSSEPKLERPFITPLYPVLPAIALVLASLCLVSLTVFNLKLALIYLGILALGYVWFYIFVPPDVRHQDFKTA